MNDIKQRLQNERCRLTTNDTGQKMLTQTDGRGLLVWTTLSEYSLQIQVDGEERLLTDGEASAEECPEKGAWVRRYRHGLLTAEVSYILTGTAALKTVRVTAGVPLTLRYAYTETAVFSGPLDRGGEGQPLFAGNRGFIASECPVAENRADGHTFSLRQAPFVSLKAGETFALSPVVFGLNTEGSMAESFWRFLRTRRPAPPAPLRIYCDWGAHDESDGNAGPTLEESMAFRLLADLRRAKEQTGLTFDYYLMDDYWYDPRQNYRAFRPDRWPDGPERFVQAVQDEGMRFGLWFDVNCQRLELPQKALRRGGDAARLCMSCRENMDRLFDSVTYQVRENHVRLLKFDFAFFDCEDAAHTFHSPRLTASKEPAVRLFCERLAALRAQYPDLRVLAYNGFTTDLSFLSSVDPNRHGMAVSPFWAEVVDYVYCGDPRPAEWPAPFPHSLLHYTDCMIEQFRDALFLPEAIDDHGTMVGNTPTVYFLGRETLRCSYLLNLVRGTRKRHLYGETGLLTGQDWQFMADTEPLFDFICSPECRTTPILQRPSEGGLYGYSNTDGTRGFITVVNAGAAPAQAVVALPEWQEGDALSFRLLYRNGEPVSQSPVTAGILSVPVAAFGVDVYAWERLAQPARSGYISVDPGKTVQVALPAGCRRAGLRFLQDDLTPLRAEIAPRQDIAVTSPDSSLSLCETVPVWSGVSFSVYRIGTAQQMPTLCLQNLGQAPVLVRWEMLPEDVSFTAAAK